MSRPKPTKCCKCGGPGGLLIGKIQVVCKQCQDRNAAAFPLDATESPPADTSPPETIEDQPEEFALILAPVLKLKAEISGYTFANNLKRVVTLCPADHAEALQAHIEAFQP
jgi:hypothetical protein